MKYRVKNVIPLIGCLDVCILLIFINKIGVDNKKTLVNCVKDLYRMGFTSLRYLATIALKYETKNGCG